MTLVPTASRTTKDIIEERGKKVEQAKNEKQEKEEQEAGDKGKDDGEEMGE